MDIYCHRCAEPWDVHEFHDVADEQGITYDEATAAFRKDGCAAIQGTQCEATGSLRAQAAGVLAELAGDDVDGLASDLADLDYLGLLDDD